jgi:hypothetical protein
MFHIGKRYSWSKSILSAKVIQPLTITIPSYLLGPTAPTWKDALEGIEMKKIKTYS